MGKGQGRGYKNLMGKDPRVHSDSARGRKQPQKLDKRLMRGALLKTRRLEDKVTGQEFSAHAGDYWNLKENDILEGVRLIDSNGVVKETVRKKDLVDEILYDKKTHVLKTQLRKPLKKEELKQSSINGHEYDEKGRFIVDGKPSNTWTFEGIADRWGHKVLDWKDYAKNPSILKDMKGSFFVIDMDNGSKRIQGKKINKDRPYF